MMLLLKTFTRVPMLMQFSLMQYFKTLLLLQTLLVLPACQMLSPRTETGPESQKGQQSGQIRVSPEVSKKYASAIQLMQTGNEAAALKVFAAVSLLNDKLSGPYVNSGLIYLKQQDKEKAEQAFRDALTRNANNVSALNQLAVLLREKKEFTAARENYEAALKIDATHQNAQLNLGILCDIYLQDKACAMQHYQAYQALNSDDEQVNNWIVDLKQRL